MRGWAWVWWDEIPRTSVAVAMRTAQVFAVRRLGSRVKECFSTIIALCLSKTQCIASAVFKSQDTKPSYSFTDFCDCFTERFCAENHVGQVDRPINLRLKTRTSGAGGRQGCVVAMPGLHQNEIPKIAQYRGCFGGTIPARKVMAQRTGIAVPVLADSGQGIGGAFIGQGLADAVDLVVGLTLRERQQLGFELRRNDAPFGKCTRPASNFCCSTNSRPTLSRSTGIGFTTRCCIRLGHDR